MRRLLLGVILAGVAALGVAAWVRRGDPAPPEAAADYDWAPGPAAPQPDFAVVVAPVLRARCVGCHNARKPSGGVDLEAAHAKSSAVWDRAAGAIRAGSMPPPEHPRLTAAEAGVLQAWFDAAGAETPRASSAYRRLNRAEYDASVRELLGLDLRLAADFPEDDIGGGFDNNGDVLSLSPLLMEKYLDAAERVVEAAFRSVSARRRLLSPPAGSPVPVALRRVTLPQRELVRKGLVLSAADLPPPDPEEEERQRYYLILEAFADRAYRRPATYQEVNRLLRFVEESRQASEGAEAGLKLAIQAILCSPDFLFRTAPGAARLDDFELASRLSYSLWGGPPDAELFALAARGTLRRGGTLAAQVRRMLRDPRSRALAEQFAPQWLGTRGLKDASPDPSLFPEFDGELRADMAEETVRFFDHVGRADRSVLDFLDADYTFANERLARHYGLAGVSGEEFRQVSLAGTPRAGVLTQAGVLTVTSNPTRTSPVKRGRWILDNLLGAPPPPPPPGVEDLPVAAGLTLRESMERHRADPACASCHARMDPLGLELEAFDAIGRAGGGEFPAGLRRDLLDRREAFARCLAEKMLAYSLGRSLARSDRRAVTDIVRKLADNDYRFSALVLAIAHAEPFSTRGAP